MYTTTIYYYYYGREREREWKNERMRKTARDPKNCT